MVMRIDTGHLGDLNLAALSWCGRFAWPKAIHDGNAEALVVISDQASPAQRNALPTTLSGPETVPGATIFNVFARRLSKCMIRYSRRLNLNSTLPSGPGASRSKA
jgi:hypothetical protein